MRYRSNQRITKIKLDKIKQLLELAESIDVKDATVIQEAGSDLAPYPNMNKLRLWTRSYLTSGLTKLYPVSVGGSTSSGEVLEPWTQPALTSNSFYDNTLNGTIQLVASSEFSSSYAAWKCMNGQSKDDIANNSWATTGTSTSGWLTVTFPTTMKIKGLDILGRATTSIKIIDNNTNKIIAILDNTESELDTVWTKVEFLVYTNSIKFEVAGTATVGISGLVFNADILVGNPPENPETAIDGDTYYTVLIDGLPIYTKLTKSLKPNVISNETEWAQPALTSNGTIGGNDYAALASTNESNHEAYKAFDNNSNTTWGPSSSNVPQWVIYYSPVPLKLTRVDFNFSTDTKEIYSTGYVEASNDNTTWTRVGEFANNNQLSFTLNLTTSDFYKYYRYTFTAHAGSYWGKAQMQQYGTIGSITEIPVTTSKPGLWLSNLSSPVSYSVAGSWIRQNLINTDSSAFDNVNNDTIGNYAYSFFQRGVIHRDAGSQHDDNDSFSMHWSPSALGCISHDAIVIPGNELQNTYTSYQTLVVPANPDMQSYQEVTSKNVQFTFVDNNDNIPLSTTTFNGRLVGKDWAYEFTVRPNFSGSGSNYEGQVRCCGQGDTGCIGGLDCSGPDAVCAECIPDDTRSNGVCITGTLITYDGCSQEIDACYKSNQYYINNGEVNPNDYSEPIKDTKHVDYLSDYVIPGWNYVGVWPVVQCSDCNIACNYIPSHKFKPVSEGKVYRGYFIGFKKARATSASCEIYRNYNYITTHYVSGGNNTRGYWFYRCDKDGNLLDVVSYGHGGSDENCTNGCVSTFNYYVDVETKEPISPDYVEPAQENVNLYLHIKDIKAEYEDMGIPWPTDCSVNRFEVSMATYVSTDKFTTSKLVYENTSISELGDISGLGLDTITVTG